ncbi:Sterol-sensing domain of SREBP cleavage-activation [Musa troglodytarum]|uniref:Sterol-sensing domain of SREBP cleavage-activation n=1 Tax=Musa troglodytarum TaxID=320322 RepID=A0A9E7EH42_9LILI|nr:Sterol-sensing domain of SREBP cleavage-activation [Musa troglodytarum]
MELRRWGFLLLLIASSTQPDKVLSSKIQSLCPTISGNVCCSPDQFDTLRGQVQQVNGNRMAVDAIDFYVTHYFGEQLFNSCKDVKFGTMNTRAMDFIGAGAKNYAEWFAYLGHQANSNEPGSPYAITFRSKSNDSSGMMPMNVKCLDLSLAIGYLFLISAFLLWGFVYRKERTDPLRTKPSINVNEESKLNSDEKQEIHCISQISEAVPPVVEAQQPVVQRYMSNFFRKYGSFVSKHPTLVLCLSLAVPLLLCLGLIHFKVETRPEKLWVGPGSKAAKEKQFFDSTLAPFYRIEQLILASIVDSNGERAPSIVTDKNLKLLFELQKKVDGLRANYSGSMVSLTDICLKPLGRNCATQSVLQYFKMDPQNYDAYGGLDHVQYCFQHFSSAEKCLSAFQAPLDPSTALGGFAGSNYSEALAFVITYPVNNELDKKSTEYAKSVAWEKAFIRLMQDELVPMVQPQNLTLSFSSESSIEEELKRESTADVITILVSYLVMFAYISVTLGDRCQLSSSFVSSKVLLGLSGVVLVMLSVLGSVGFYSIIGVKSTLIIMEVIPFLVLAVGVDNMCILVHAVKRQPLELVLEERISNALVEVGPSITLASLSEVLAFAVELKMTELIVFHVLDLHQAAALMKDVHAPLLSLQGVKIVVVAVFFGFAFASIALCTRVQPGLEQKVVLPRDSYLQSYFDDIAKYLRVGPPLYFVLKDFNYSLGSRNTNQICSISQCDPNSFLNEITKASLVPSSSYIAKPAASWLDDFLIWLSPEAFSCCRAFLNGSYCPPDDQCFRYSDLHDGRPSTVQFKEKLPWFLSALPSSNCAKGGKGAYTSSVNISGYESGIIQASAFRTYHTPLSKQSDYVNSMKAAQDFSSKMSDSLKGVMAILDIQLNAISVVNLVMSIGIAVEFCVHVMHAFLVNSGDRGSRTTVAVSTMGASVFSGITLTKLVGVIVLRFSKSEVFVVYFFQMYIALVLIGFLHGLVFLPVILSICGPPPRSMSANPQEHQWTTQTR